MKFSIPARQANLWAVCWNPEPTSTYATQMSSKHTTNPELLESTSFTAYAQRDCTAHVQLCPGITGLAQP